jgi:alpha-galactosidase
MPIWDFWDNWTSLKRQFEIAHRWESQVGPESWPDADMLPLGRIGIRAERGDDRFSLFTQDEQRTVMTLWSIFRSPLMFGGDLPSNNAFTLSLITNPEILEVNQHSTGGHQSYQQGDTIAWTAEAEGRPADYIAVFNVGDAKATVELKWTDVGVSAKQPRVRDLWLQKDEGPLDGLKVTLEPHGSAIYRVEGK